MSAPFPGHGFPPGIALTALAPGRGGGGGRRPGGVGLPERDVRVSPCGEGEPPPRSPPPVAISTTVQCTGTSLEELVPGPLSPPKNRCQRRSPSTASHRLSPRTAPAPEGRGRRPKAGRGGGCRRETYEYPLQECRVGWGLPERDFLVTFCPGRGRPLPGPLPPWRYPHGPVHGETPGKNWFRARSLPQKPASAPLPGHGFPPGIATHCPRPSGAGEEAEGRAGWGCRRGTYEYPLQECRAGWGLPEKRMSIPSRNAGRGGGCRSGTFW